MGVTFIGGENGMRLFGIVSWRSSIVNALDREREVEGRVVKEVSFSRDFVTLHKCRYSLKFRENSNH